MKHSCHTRDERGAIGGIEGLAFGVLIFVFGTFMVLNTWAIVDGGMAASGAAREAARAYVEAPSEDLALDDATSAAEASLQNHAHYETSVSIEPDSASGSFGRCVPIRATVTMSVPRIALGAIGGKGGTVKVSASHVEVVDPYRSGLPGLANCSV